MERLTERDKNGTAMAACCGSECKYNYCCCEVGGFSDCRGMDNIIDRLAAYEDTGLEPCDYSAMAHALKQAERAREDLTEMIRQIGATGLDRLRELAQADRLIGKTVYYPIAGKILEKRVSSFVIYDERRAGLRPKESWFCVNNDNSETFDFSDIGRTIFLTREEAEAALRREQDG